MNALIRPLTLAAMASLVAMTPAYAADSNKPKGTEVSRPKTDRDLPKGTEVSRPKTDKDLPKGTEPGGVKTDKDTPKTESNVRRTSRGR